MHLKITQEEITTDELLESYDIEINEDQIIVNHIGIDSIKEYFFRRNLDKIHNHQKQNS